MSYVAFCGARSRDPARVLRLVQPNGEALHVLEVDQAEAEKIAGRTGGAVYEDREAAIRDTLERAGVAR